MTFYTQNIARTQTAYEGENHIASLRDSSLQTSVRQIAAENAEAWLPNPVMHRFLEQSVSHQFLTASQLESSSAHIENLAIALDVLQDRRYQQGPDSAFRLQATGQGLGGASAHEIQELRTQVRISEAQISALNTLIPKVRSKLQRAATREKARKYQNRLHEYQRDLENERVKLAQRQAALSNAQR